MVRISVIRTFTSGHLAGIAVPQTWHCTPEQAGKVGDVFVNAKPVFGDPYVDTTMEVRPL